MSDNDAEFRSTKFLTRGPITPRMHGTLDYPLAAILLAGPFLFDFDQATATAVVLAIGVAAAGLAVGTAWSRGIVHLVAPLLHGILDIGATSALIAAPFLGGFSGDHTATSFCLAVGGSGLAATLLTRFVSDLPARVSGRIQPAL